MQSATALRATQSNNYRTPWLGYFHAQNFTGAILDARSVAPQNQVRFTGFSSNSTWWQSYDRQVTPTPEPAAYGLIFVTLTIGLTYRLRRRSNGITPGRSV